MWRAKGTRDADWRRAVRYGMVLLALMGVVNPAAGDDAVSPAGRISVSELEALQAETLLYEARLARDKAKNELKKYGGADVAPAPREDLAQRDEDTSSNTGGGEIPIAQGLTNTGEAALPQVIQIFGQGGRLQATLLLPPSQRVTVGQGGGIPGTPFVVRQITPQHVVVQKPGGAASTLAFVQ